MAKRKTRRRSRALSGLGSASELHRKNGRLLIFGAAKIARMAVRSAQRGDCSEALRSYGNAAMVAGRASEAINSTDGRHTSVRVGKVRDHVFYNEISKAEAEVKACFTQKKRRK